MTARTIMVQGTASNAGKSLLATALCRIFRQDGWRVAPFKSQNMSNNSYFTPDGLEIGVAQGAQAEAAGIPATADMNPVLLKPSGEKESQVVIHGRPYATMDFRAYRREGYELASTAIRTSLAYLQSQFDVVVIEGAGSPAEVNLRDRELVNMRIAEWAGAPVLLAADIDRGGALASLVGTLALLEPHEQDRVAGLIINKFRGDRALLQPAVDFLEERTGKPVVGVVPYLDVDLEAEDSQALPQSSSFDEGIRICALRLPRVSNVMDLDPLRRAPGVQVDWVQEPARLTGADAVVIPSSQNPAADLRWLWQTGLGAAVQRLAARGVPVVGIGGGYQMLGNRLLEPSGEMPGLELLDLEAWPAQERLDRAAWLATESPDPETGLAHEQSDQETQFTQERPDRAPRLAQRQPDPEPWPPHEKTPARITARIAHGRGPFAGRSGIQVTGVALRTGLTQLGPGSLPLFRAAVEDGAGGAPGAAAAILGASDAAGQVWGTSLHNIFANDALRRSWLAWLWRRRGLTPPSEAGVALEREEMFDRLAAGVRASLDMDRIYQIMGLVRP